MLATMLRALPATKGFALLPRENRPARTSHVSEQKPSEDGRLKGREGTGPLLPEDALRCERAPGDQGKESRVRESHLITLLVLVGITTSGRACTRSQRSNRHTSPLLSSARARGVSSG